MKRLLIALVLPVCAALAAPAAAATFTIDPAHTSVGFTVRHMMVSNVRGSFGDFAGTVDYDSADPQAWKVEATIQAASVNTGVPKRDDDLRSPDFFDVAAFPTLTFRSTGVKPAPDGAYLLTGDLTMHGVTKPVTLTLVVNGMIKDPWGNLRVGFSATGKLSRAAYGLTWNKAIETGGAIVGDEVTLALEVEATRKP
ncbi:MAG: YceI family protein [Candidatus Krumholzibacteriia bacterium]